jgi:hypothetical protein
MLKSPSTFNGCAILQSEAELNDNYSGLLVLEPGVVQTGHFNLDRILVERMPFEMRYPNFEKLNCYGVCDSPKQFLDKYRKMLEKDPRTLIVGFTHVRKSPEGRGKFNGWRWHKWGEYVGEGSPKHEYLDDEDGFDNGIYTYSIIEWEPH